MKIKNKLALFDYDGTIVDSAKMIVKGAIEAFRVCGIPDPDPKKVRENIGKPLAIALKEYMPEGYNISPNQISEAYKNWYAEQGRLGLQDEPIFPGMKDLLKRLQDSEQWYLGIATNKSRIALENGLAKHDLKNYFDITLTTDEIEPKPSPEMALIAIKTFNVDRKHTVIIGDTINDIGLGVNAKIMSIGVGWGYNKKEVLLSSGANKIVNNSSELFEVLNKNFLLNEK